MPLFHFCDQYVNISKINTTARPSYFTSYKLNYPGTAFRRRRVTQTRIKLNHLSLHGVYTINLLIKFLSIIIHSFIKKQSSLFFQFLKRRKMTLSSDNCYFSKRWWCWANYRHYWSLNGNLTNNNMYILL